MKSNIIIYSDELTKNDIQLLLQAIRDCEQGAFPDKDIGVFLFVPELTTEECTRIMEGVKPQFKYGPFVLGGKNEAK